MRTSISFFAQCGDVQAACNFVVDDLKWIPVNKKDIKKMKAMRKSFLPSRIFLIQMSNEKGGFYQPIPES